MSNIAVRVNGLGKVYHIGARQKNYRTLAEAVSATVTYGLRSIRSGLRLTKVRQRNGDDTIWALKNVSFEIKRGEVVGVIGRNGAGKSTLLKILSRITEPTTGIAEIRGRLSSLLEVGTGFHGELTGRENTYLNGAILGMGKAEIDRKFDEIVAFADVDKFIDTPVKHYSSGMQMRLAFAVAAHLEPEILIVDEVLAVGDASFQKKCLNKMEDVGQQGRTVLFVSHNMQAITRLCKRTILLDEGKIIADGPSHKVVGVYLNSGRGTTASREWPDPINAPAGEVARLRAVRVRTEKGEVADVIDIRRPARVEMEYEVIKPGYVLMPYFDFYNEAGVLAFGALDLDPTWRRKPRPVGLWISTVWIPGNLLSEGTVFVTLGVTTTDPAINQFYERDAAAFEVVDSLDGDSARGDFAGKFSGVIRPLLKWTTQYRDAHEHEVVTTATTGADS